MNRQPSLSRPKILALGSNGVGVATSAIQEIAWPCHAFRVTLPVGRRGHLNIFEGTVLRLIGLARSDVGKLADTTCLDPDLIKFILLRLQDNGLVDETLELTEEAKKYIGLRENSSPAYESRIVFRELVGNQLLPVLLEDVLGCEHLLQWDRYSAKIETGTTGNSKHIDVRIIQSNGHYATLPPSAAEVLAVFRQHQRLSRQYARFHGKAEANIVVQPGQINVVEDPEIYFLRCQVIIPAGGTDFLVTDPFGYGCSALLEQAYRVLISTEPDEESRVLRLKEKAIIRRVGVDGQAPLTIDTNRISAEYPELRRLFNSIRDLWQKCKVRVAPGDRSRDREVDLELNRQHLVQDIYSAVEWALRYCLDRSRDESQCHLLTMGSRTTNAEILIKMAKSIGFHTDKLGYLLNVAPERIRSFEFGGTDMQALLAVAIASSYQSPFHPVRRLASVMPDWLLFIKNLKRVRDPAAHGESTGIVLADLEKFQAVMCVAIDIILPDVGGKLGLVTDKTPRDDDRNMEYEARIVARISLDRIFGVQGFKLMSGNIANLLIGVERNALLLPADKDVEVGNLVGDLCSALQSAIHQVATDFRSPINISAATMISRARECAATAGFSLEGGGLPRSLATVKHDLIEQTLSGLSSSLGASTIALLLVAPKQWLERAALRLPDYLIHIGKLIDLRGHGNQSILISPDTFINTKERSYEVIKTTIET